MNRKISQWEACDPKAMAKMSEAAIMYALSDAKADILELFNDIKKIAYPARGSESEYWDIYDACDYLQAKYSIKDFD